MSDEDFTKEKTQSRASERIRGIFKVYRWFRCGVTIEGRATYQNLDMMSS